MKRINCIVLVLTLCVLTFGSCKKSAPPIPIPQIANTSISLKFSGGLYVSSNAMAIYNKKSDVIQIGGVFDNANSLISLIIANVQVGTFDLSAGNARASLSFYDGVSAFDTYKSISGTIVITAFTATTIAGTFEFMGIDPSNVTRAITEGQFTTSYVTQ